MHPVLLQLKKEITPFEFDNYITQLNFNEKYSRDDRIIFNAPNNIIASWIKTKYSSKIAQLFEKQSGYKPEIIIEVFNPNKRKESKNNIKKIQNATNLNPSLTFNSFIVGNSNSFAFNVAKAVAQNQSTIYK